MRQLSAVEENGLIHFFSQLSSIYMNNFLFFFVTYHLMTGYKYKKYLKKDQMNM